MSIKQIAKEVFAPTNSPYVSREEIPVLPLSESNNDYTSESDATEKSETKTEEKTKSVVSGPTISHLREIVKAEMQQNYYYFFLYLYGLFPCNFIQFLKTEFSNPNNAPFIDRVKPLISEVNFNTILLEYTPETELLPERWKSTNLDTVLRSCLKPFQYESMIKGLSWLREYNENQQIVETKINNNQISETILKIQKLVETMVSENLTSLGISRWPHLSSSFQDQAILVLQNKLLYERYLQNQSLQIIHSYHKDEIKIRQLDEKLEEMTCEIEQYKAREQFYLQQFKEQHKDIQSLKEIDNKLRNQLSTCSKWLTQKENELKEVNNLKKTETEKLTNEIEKLKEKDDLNTSTIFKLETQLATQHEYVNIAIQYQKRIKLLNEELIVWEEQRKKCLNYSEKLNLLQEQLKQKNDIIAQHIKYQYDVNEILRLLKSKLKYATENSQVLAKELEDEKHRLNSKEEIFKEQQNVFKFKVDALEKKYTTVKQINLGLEKFIMQLQTEMETLKIFTNKLQTEVERLKNSKNV